MIVRPDTFLQAQNELAKQLTRLINKLFCKDNDFIDSPIIENRGDRAPGFWPGDAGAREWDRRKGTGRKGRDKFHDLKGRDKGPASAAADDTSVNPETGEVRDGNGEEIGNLGD